MDNFNIIKPSTAMAPYVSHYWTLRLGGTQPAGERVIPTGTASLVFHRGELMMQSQTGSTQPRAFVSGISTSYSDVATTGRLEMLVAVFKPLGASVFLARPANEFRSLSVAVEDTGDRELAELSERVIDAASDLAAVEMIEIFLARRLNRTADHDMQRIEAVIRSINNDPQTSVSAAADIACLSTRQFGRVFSARVGVTPKDFMRIVRFQRALHHLQSGIESNLSQLAAGCGYYDQAHMIKEFREFSGYSPTEFLSLCDPYSDYFTEP